MPLKEYSKDYVQNNARNWLKIQQDIAFVEKSLKGSGTPRREIMKSLLERKTSVENDKRQLDLQLLTSRTWRRRKQLSCWKLLTTHCHFPWSAIETLLALLPVEEEEQLCMVKQLSLGSIPFDNGDNTEQTKETANILLSGLQVSKGMNETLCMVIYVACMFDWPPLITLLLF